MKNHSSQTKFQIWFETFLEEKGIDMSELVTAGDGSILQLGDVCSAVLMAPASEQALIKNMLVHLDFKNLSITDYLAHLAKALNVSHKM